MNEELLALLNAGSLAEDVKQKISDAFKAAVDQKVETLVVGAITEKTAELETQFESKINSEISRLEDLNKKYMAEEIVPMVDKYLTAAATEFFTENKPQLESQIKVNLAESFLTGMVSLAKAHNVEIPKGVDNIVEDLQSQVTDLKEKLNTQIDAGLDNAKQLKEATKQLIISNQTLSLTESQREKVFAQAASIEFADEDSLKSSVAKLIESIAPSATEPEQSQQPITESNQLPAQNTFESQLRKQLFSKA